MVLAVDGLMWVSSGTWFSHRPLLIVVAHFLRSFQHNVLHFPPLASNELGIMLNLGDNWNGERALGFICAVMYASMN